MPVLFPFSPGKQGERPDNLIYFTPFRVVPGQIIPKDSLALKTYEGDHSAAQSGDQLYDLSNGVYNVEARSGYFAGHPSGRQRLIFTLRTGLGSINVNTNCSFHSSGQYLDVPGREYWRRNDLKQNLFFVFDENVSPDDMKWIDPFTLVNLKTNDEIKFTDNRCGHFVFKEDGELKPFEWIDFYDHL